MKIGAFLGLTGLPEILSGKISTQNVWAARDIDDNAMLVTLWWWQLYDIIDLTTESLC